MRWWFFHVIIELYDFYVSCLLNYLQPFIMMVLQNKCKFQIYTDCSRRGTSNLSDEIFLRWQRKLQLKVYRQFKRNVTQLLLLDIFPTSWHQVTPIYRELSRKWFARFLQILVCKSRVVRLKFWWYLRCCQIFLFLRIVMTFAISNASRCIVLPFEDLRNTYLYSCNVPYT